MKDFINRVHSGNATPSDEFLTLFLIVAIPALFMMIMWAYYNRK